ncbi:MAG: MiaB/RimO family radical SAM methylthiotransferase [Phycisphaerales bacterium]|nr:MiaB/RimO family radical SAM methylthiotransferase [Phycisphaerales bacterium]
MATTACYRIHTLGCRVNHAETRDLEAIMQARGLAPARPGDPAAVEVIHSCAVTARAAAKSRNAARRAARRQADGPGLVLMTGCLPAEATDGPAATAAGAADRCIDHADRAGTGLPMTERFTRRLDQFLQTAPASDAPTVPLRVLDTEGPRARQGHVRAELKIQDGCDAHCTFCIIPSLRPTLRSKPLETVVDEAKALVDAGHMEIVLTGIFIGAWGHETALRRKQRTAVSPLADLIDAVAQVPGLQRLRVSSMEPGDLDEPVLDAMVANAGVVVPHLHLPLQSGADAILRTMNRQYDTAAYRDMLAMANAALTTDDGLRPAITTDIICGFPGETDAHFQETLDMVNHAGFLHMHVFPYSPRQGTAAARWTSKAVPGNIARARVRRLIEIEHDPDGLAQGYRRSLLHRPTRMILEQRDPDRPEHWLGRCDHYALVSVHGNDRSHIGQCVQALPCEIEDDVLLATLAPATIALPQASPHEATEGHTCGT